MRFVENPESNDIAMCKSPLISVLMPVFNADRYIENSIQSILSQSFPDFELLIINDGSTDRSRDILENWSNRDDRIRLRSRSNFGIVKTLNELLGAAVGEYIARMDADDLCEPNRFSLQLQAFNEIPNLVAVGSNAIAIDPDGDLIGDAPVPLNHNEIEAAHLSGHSSIYHPAVMMRRNAVSDVGGYREEAFPCEDYDLWLRLGERGRLANLPEKLFHWRRTETGIVASKSAMIESKIQWVLNDTWCRRKLPGEPIVPKVRALSTIDLHMQWAWSSLRYGNLRTARKYSFKCFLNRPWSRKSIILLLCTLRGR